MKSKKRGLWKSSKKIIEKTLWSSEKPLPKIEVSLNLKLSLKLTQLKLDNLQIGVIGAETKALRVRCFDNLISGDLQPTLSESFTSKPFEQVQRINECVLMEGIFHWETLSWRLWNDSQERFGESDSPSADQMMAYL